MDLSNISAMFHILGTASTIWDSLSTFVSDNSPLLTTALLAVFAIPVAFALYGLCKKALNKST